MADRSPPIPGFPSPDRGPTDSEKVVFDTVVGPNVRWKDNLFQGVAIVVCLILGVPIGYYSATDREMGAVLGGGGGLLVGLFGSGIFLMIYRAIGHARGRHG